MTKSWSQCLLVLVLWSDTHNSNRNGPKEDLKQI